MGFLRSTPPRCGTGDVGRTALVRYESTRPARRHRCRIEGQNCGGSQVGAVSIFASELRYPEWGNSGTATPSLRAFLGGIHVRGKASV
jgi:hypothetical protein